MNYKNTVSKFREIARDTLRMQVIESYLHEIFETKKDLKNAENKIKTSEEGGTLDKNLNRLEYKLSVLDDQDPDFTSKKEKLEKDIENEKEYIDRLTKETKMDITDYEKAITKMEEEIGKIEKGETKMEHDSISRLAKKMAARYNNERIRNLAGKIEDEIKA